MTGTPAGTGTEPAQRRSVLGVLRHAPPPVWVLVVGVFVNRVGSFFSIFVVLFLTAEGFTTADLPPILAAVGATSMLGSLGGGWLADLLGRKTALVTSMTASALSLGFLALASGRLQIVAAVCLVGLCSQSYVPAASALLVDHSAPSERVPVFALFRLALNLGAAIGPLLAGFIATSSYTALFLVDGGTALLFAAVLAAGLPNAARPAREKVPRESPGLPPAPPTPSAGPAPVLLLCLALLGVAMAYAQHTSTLPLRLTANGESPRFFGFLLSFNAALVIALELPLSGWTRRLSPRLPLTAGALLITLGMAASGVARAGVAVLATVAVWSLGEILLAPVAGAAVADLSPPERIGRYQGVLSTAQTLGFSLGPAAGTYAIAVDERLPWLGCAVAGIAAVLLINVAYAAAPRAATSHAHPSRLGRGRHALAPTPARSTVRRRLRVPGVRHRYHPRHARRSGYPDRAR